MNADQINSLVTRIRAGEKPPREELAEALKGMLADRLAVVDTPKPKAAKKKVDSGFLDDLLKE